MNVNDVRDTRHVTSSNMTLTHAAMQVSVMFINVWFRAILLYAYKCTCTAIRTKRLQSDAWDTRREEWEWNDYSALQWCGHTKLRRCEMSFIWKWWSGDGGEGNVLRKAEESQIDERWVMRAVININHTRNLNQVNYFWLAPIDVWVSAVAQRTYVMCVSISSTVFYAKAAKKGHHWTFTHRKWMNDFRVSMLNLVHVFLALAGCCRRFELNCSKIECSSGRKYLNFICRLAVRQMRYTEWCKFKVNAFCQCRLIETRSNQLNSWYTHLQSSCSISIKCKPNESTRTENEIV